MYISYVELYVAAFFVFMIGFLFSTFIFGTKYKDKYRDDLKAFKAALDKETAEKEKLKAERSRDIAHAVTNEWNKGYNAAFLRLEESFKYIHQWEKEHGMTTGELEALSKDFKEEEK